MDKPMNEREDCITMITDSGESVDFYVLEETRIHGKDYLLVTDAPEDEDGECYILKDVSGENVKLYLSSWKMTGNWMELWAFLKSY